MLDVRYRHPVDTHEQCQVPEGARLRQDRFLGEDEPVQSHQET